MISMSKNWSNVGVLIKCLMRINNAFYIHYPRFLLSPFRANDSLPFLSIPATQARSISRVNSFIATGSNSLFPSPYDHVTNIRV